MKDKKEVIVSFFKNFLFAVFVFIIFIGVLLSAYEIYSKRTFIQNQQTESKIRELEQQAEQTKETDYQSIKSVKIAKTTELKELTIVENHKDLLPAKKNSHGGIEKQFSIKGKILFGYLYIESSVSDRKFISWENIYFSIRQEKLKPVGGHLLQRGLLETEDKTNKNIFLYRLDAIPYVIKNDGKTEIANFTDNINNNWQNNNITINAWIDSGSKNRIMSVYIYYKCDESTPDCSIESV